QPWTPEQKLQILAWSYGFMMHAAGDLWAHTLVNEFSGGPFVGPLEIPTDPVEGVANDLRHIILESYIGDATPGFDGNSARSQLAEGDFSKDSPPAIELDAPHEFIYQVLIQPWAGQPTASRGPVLDLFLALRNQLNQQLQAPPQAVIQTV